MDGDSEDDASSLMSADPIFNQDHDDDISLPSICSHHGSMYPCCETFTTGNEQGVTVMGYIKRTPNAQDIPWVMAWLQGEQERIFVGVSLSLINCGIFPIDDLSVEFRSILEWEDEIESRSGSDCENSFHISAVLNQSPTGPLCPLMPIMRHTWLRPEE